MDTRRYTFKKIGDTVGDIICAQITSSKFDNQVYHVQNEWFNFASAYRAGFETHYFPAECRNPFLHCECMQNAESLSIALQSALYCKMLTFQNKKQLRKFVRNIIIFQFDDPNLHFSKTYRSLKPE
jgi:hypothetical protein